MGFLEDMINTIIIKYLRENRRLVIPKLGAFIVKDDNQTIIFSELLRSDDVVYNRDGLDTDAADQIRAIVTAEKCAVARNHNIAENYLKN